MGIKSTGIAILFALLSAPILWAQEGPNRFHEVKAGETKYGISRQYGISIETLEAYNPEIKMGLKAGSQLLIPTGSAEAIPAADTADGQDSTYVLHRVKAGQTLFALSRDYGISVVEIKAHNPGLADALQVGQIVKIPKAAIDRPEKPPLTEGFFVHEVSAGETAYSLSRKYQVSLDSLYRFNPAAEEGLSIGQQLRIPKTRSNAAFHPSAPAPAKDTSRAQEQLKRDPGDEAGGVPKRDTPPEAPSEYYLYKVKTGDSFYSLKVNLGAEREELLELNPELEKGLVVGNYIIVPRREAKAQNQKSWLDRLFGKEEAPKTGPVEAQTRSRKDSLNAFPPLDSAVGPPFQDTNFTALGKTFRVALFLPFGTESLKDTLLGPSPQLNATQKMALDFYQGFKAAADSLSAEGMQLELRVFDSAPGKFKLQRMMPELRRAKFDLIVGPAFKQNVEYLADALQKEGVPVISPLSRSVEVKQRPNLVQMVPDQSGYYAVYADILNRHFQEARVVFAHSGGGDEVQQVQQIKARLQPRSDSNFIDQLTITEGDLVQGLDLKSVLREDQKTVVVLIGEEKDFATDVVRRLNALNDSNIYLVGSPDLVEIETIENDYLSRLHYTMPEVRYIDYQNDSVRSFIGHYRETHAAEPSGFSFQGYDLGQFVLRHLWRRGPFFLDDLPAQGRFLSTGYALERTEQGGLVNRHLFITGIRAYHRVALD